MFTIALPAGKALTVRCMACKQQVQIKKNKAPAEFKMAFNHPKQEIKDKCPACGAEMVWLPEEAVISDASGA